jgi:predicted 3-demethylubiquinone-9 3-methyltransferase (glyoxalase superfamily)
MQRITTFLWYDGRAHEAAEFYVSIFEDSRIVEKSDMIVTFELAGQRYIALNGGPHYQFTPAISLFVSCDTQAEVDRYWDRLLEGGEPSRCGWLRDKFGLSWQIVPTLLGELLGDDDEEKADRVMQAMLQMVKLDSAALQAAYDAV